MIPDYYANLLEEMRSTEYGKYYNTFILNYITFIDIVYIHKCITNNNNSIKMGGEMEAYWNKVDIVYWN